MALYLPNSVFLHFPKTGGMWVEEALKRGFQGRVQSTHERHVGLSGVPENRFRFCFVRHPLGWYRSYWCFKMTRQYWDTQNPFDQFVKSDTFDGFMNKVFQWRRPRLYEYMEEFVGIPDRKVDFVGKLENLKEDLIKALCFAGETDFDASIMVSTPRVNESNNEFKDQARFSEELASRVMQHEKEYCQAFGYTEFSNDAMGAQGSF